MELRWWRGVRVLWSIVEELVVVVVVVVVLNRDTSPSLSGTMNMKVPLAYDHDARWRKSKRRKRRKGEEEDSSAPTIKKKEN